jgi:hypothetical protein
VDGDLPPPQRDCRKNAMTSSASMFYILRALVEDERALALLQ